MKKIVLLLLAVSLVAFACKRDTQEITETDFTGKDNYIASFVLQKDGVSYPAVIRDGKITVTVPYNLSLDGATASYEVSENSSLNPDPAQITRWDEDWKFIVTSYTTQDRVYTYTVERSDVASAGHVTLLTQAEVDAFEATGIRTVKGNLIIGSNTSDETIDNLAGLKNIREIENLLIVNGSYRGDDLTGLDNVKKIGGFHLGTPLSAAGNKTLSVVALTGLESVAGDFIVNSDRVTHVSLPAVERIGGDLTLSSSALVYYDSNLLEEIGGDFTLNGSTGTAVGSQVEYISLPALRSIGGDLGFNRLARLFGMSFGELESVGNISYNSCPELLGFIFSEIRTVGDLTITGCSELLSIRFPKLEACGRFIVEQCTGLTTFACPLLQSIGGDFTLTGSASLSGLEMGSLERIDGTLTLSGLNIVDGITELESLASVRGMSLTGLRSMTVLDVSGIDFQGGELRVQDHSFASLQKIVGPEHFRGSLRFVVSSSARDVTGIAPLEGFDRIDGSLTVTLTANQTTPVQCDNIRSIAGDLWIEDSGAPVYSFQKLEEIGGRLLLCQKNPTVQVADFPALQKVGKELNTSTISASAALNFGALKTVGDGSQPEYGAYTLHIFPYSDRYDFSSLEKINGSAFIQSPWITLGSIASLGFPVLATVTGDLHIGDTDPMYAPYANTTITALDFPALTTVNGTLKIYCLAAVNDFSTFRSALASLDSKRWDVQGCAYNPDYQAMLDGNYAR